MKIPQNMSSTTTFVRCFNVRLCKATRFRATHMFEQLELCATFLSDLRWELGEGIPGAAWLRSSASPNLFSLLLWIHPDGSKLWYSVGEKKERKSTNQLHFANKEVHFWKHNLGINCELSMIASRDIYKIIQLRQNSNNNNFFKIVHILTFKKS